jgi:hypothetical protein
MLINRIASSLGPCRVEASSETTASEMWFKSDPLDHAFLYRAVQLQLQTDARGHGHSEAVVAGGPWSWFELVVFKDKDAMDPLERDGKLLVWRSHGNRMDVLDQANSLSRHYGVIFDRRHELLDILEVRDYFAFAVSYPTDIILC